MLEREFALPAVQDVSEIFDISSSPSPQGWEYARGARSSEIRSPNWICMIREVRGEKTENRKMKKGRNVNFGSPHCVFLPFPSFLFFLFSPSSWSPALIRKILSRALPRVRTLSLDLEATCTRSLG